ncbi:MAG TPA: leucine-rich repeat domain-containing protein [Oligoflexus sp.]|uniref:leucine-rich repeat domain-containing protein n=1 Tax=Oligoflexus sp. TaxID=1971216 RepID=UPI002D63913B|nr:leucine-rich repeat domain-containing protein [Oligoflexus sp.]HYX32365.1 leucine-rich repeat domain-containing protein [Oligoflexus sp.]
MKSKLGIVLMMISVVFMSCTGKRWQNQINALALECGVPKNYSFESVYILKLNSTRTISDKNDVQAYTVLQTTDRSVPLDFNLSPKNCLMFERADLEGVRRVSVIVQNREAAEFVPNLSESILSNAELKECGRHCQAFPLCGLLPNTGNSDAKSSVLKMNVAEGVKANVSVESDFASFPLEVNERQCFVLSLSSAGKLKIQDAHGNFFDDIVENVVAQSSRNKMPVHSISLRGPLTEQEKRCRQDPVHYRMDGENCVAKSFRYYCEDSPSHASVIALSQFFVRKDCERIEEFLRNQTSLDFSYKSLIDAEIFSGLENMQHLDLRGNKLSSLASVRELPNLESLKISRNSGRFDIASVARFRQLKKLDIRLSPISNVDQLPVMGSVEELKISAEHTQILAKFTGLKRLYIEGGDRVDLSKLPNANLQFLSILSVSELVGLESLQQFPGLEELELNFVENLGKADFPEIQSLRTLTLKFLPLLNLNNLQTMSALHELTLESNTGIPFLGILPKLNQIKSLKYLNYEMLDLSWLEQFSSLEKLTLQGNLDTFESLPLLPSLFILDTQDLALGNLKGLHNSPNLKYLRLFDKSNVLDLNDLPQLPYLENFFYQTIPVADQVLPPSDIFWMQKVPSLRILSVDINPKQQNLEDYLPKNIEDLAIYSYGPISLDFLSNMPYLKRLELDLNETTIKDAQHIIVRPLDFVAIFVNIDSLRLLPKFMNADVLYLNVDSEGSSPNETAVLGEKILAAREVTLGAGARDVSWLKNLVDLEYLSLSTFLSSLENFPDLPSVKSLTLKDTANIAHLAGIDKFKNLEEIDFAGNWTFNTLEPLLNLKSLRLIKNADRMRGNFLDEQTCPESMEAPKGLREYCRNLQLPFATPLGPLPF